MNDKTPVTWLLDELRAAGRSDLVREFHARQQAYQKKLDKQKRDEREQRIQRIKEVRMFTAYERDINAGRATERILVSSEGIIVDQTWETFNKADEIDLPVLVGLLADDVVAQKGFTRVTNWQETERLYDIYQNKQEPVPYPPHSEE
jgi:hypothetical protein